MLLLDQLNSLKNSGADSVRIASFLLSQKDVFEVSQDKKYPSLFIITPYKDSNPEDYNFKDLVLSIYDGDSGARVHVESIGLPRTGLHNKVSRSTYSIVEKIDGDLVAVWYSQSYAQWMYRVDGEINPSSEVYMGQAVTWNDFVVHYILNRFPSDKDIRKLIWDSAGGTAFGGLIDLLIGALPGTPQAEALKYLNKTFFFQACSRQNTKIVPQKSSKVYLINIRDNHGSRECYCLKYLGEFCQGKAWHIADSFRLKAGLKQLVGVYLYCKASQLRKGFLIVDEVSGLPIRSITTDWYRREVKLGKLFFSALRNFTPS